jgi:rubrerythrin
MPSSPFHEVRVVTLGQLFAVAEAMEVEAARRYATMARTMDVAGSTGLAGLFRELERAEQGHARHVAGWAEATLGRRAAPAAVGWRTPEGQELGDLDRDPRLLTPYRALGVAVHNEERAFGFYSHVAASTEDEAVRRQAEAFAREELGHAAWLRQKRRRAYHAEGRGRRWRLGGDRPSSPAAFLATAAALERALAERHAACAARLRAAGDPAAAAVAEVARLDGEEAARLERSVPPAAERAAVVPPDTDALAPADCALDLEEAYEAYTAAADALVTEEALREAQALAESAVARIGRLRGWPARGAETP